MEQTETMADRGEMDNTAAFLWQMHSRVSATTFYNNISAKILKVLQCFFADK